MTGLTRARSVLLFLVCAGLLWIIAGRQWSEETAPASQVPGVAAVGSASSTGSGVLTACAAVVAVCALLLAMLSTVGRWVVCVLAALAAAVYCIAAISALTGSEQPLTAWPWVGLAAGLCTIAAAVTVAVAGREWTVSKRYSRTSETDTDQSPQDDPTGAWDALSRGEDPS